MKKREGQATPFDLFYQDFSLGKKENSFTRWHSVTRTRERENGPPKDPSYYYLAREKRGGGSWLTTYLLHSGRSERREEGDVFSF